VLKLAKRKPFWKTVKDWLKYIFDVLSGGY